MATNFVARPSPFAGLGFGFLAVYIFLLFSRASEFMNSHTNFHLVLVIALIAGALSLMTGGLIGAFSTKSGFWLTLCTCYMFTALPFSIWHGGSVKGFFSGWVKSYLSYLLVAALITNLQHVRKAIFSIALATAVILVIANYYTLQGTPDGRLTLEWGTLGNANDLAAQILIGLPFCVYVITDKTRNAAVRVGFAAVSALLLLTVMKTGSRGALPAILVLGGYVFWKTSITNKAKLIVVFLALAGAMPFVLTQDIKNRYLTIVFGENLEQRIEDHEEYANVHSANESTQARRALLTHAFQITFHHPLFGIGYEQFANADALMSESKGEDPMWHQVHNIFAVIMSENGIPALVFFVMALYYAFRIVLKTYHQSKNKPQEEEISRAAFCLLASLVTYFICNMFSTNAYGFQFPVLGGFIAAFEAIVNKAAMPVALPPVVQVGPRYRPPHPVLQRRPI